MPSWSMLFMLSAVCTSKASTVLLKKQINNIKNERPTAVQRSFLGFCSTQHFYCWPSASAHTLPDASVLSKRTIAELSSFSPLSTFVSCTVLPFTNCFSSIYAQILHLVLCHCASNYHAKKTNSLRVNGIFPPKRAFDIVATPVSNLASTTTYPSFRFFSPSIRLCPLNFQLLCPRSVPGVVILLFSVHRVVCVLSRSFVLQTNTWATACFFFFLLFKFRRSNHSPTGT